MVSERAIAMAARELTADPARIHLDKFGGVKRVLQQRFQGVFPPGPATKGGHATRADCGALMMALMAATNEDLRCKQELSRIVTLFSGQEPEVDSEDEPLLELAHAAGQLEGFSYRLTRAVGGDRELRVTARGVKIRVMVSGSCRSEPEFLRRLRVLREQVTQKVAAFMANFPASTVECDMCYLSQD